jgi:hypothetical protein
MIDRPASLRTRFLLLLAFFLFFPAAALPGAKFVPAYIEKIAPGNPFFPFRFADLSGKAWSLDGLRGKSVLILSAHRDVRYDVEVWAKALSAEYGPRDDIQILWVVDLSRYPWLTTERHAEKFWEEFRAPVPVVLDWHAQIGRSLRLRFGTPNLIGIDSLGRLAFHETLVYSKTHWQMMKAQIGLLLKNAELPGRGYAETAPVITTPPPVSPVE